MTLFFHASIEQQERFAYHTDIEALEQQSSNFNTHQNHMKGLLKHRWLGHSIPRVSDSIDLGWGLRICISNEFPANVVAVVQRPHTEKHCSRRSFWNY